jgi:glycerophosphoryl diester phosphodiesterase
MDLPKIIGHRGACGYAPENTFASFKKALSFQCHYIEFDVMLSADGIPFVFHDVKLKRTTNGKGEVGQVSADYLESLDAGRWYGRQFADEKIPQFSAMLEWLLEFKVSANIEIKPYPGTSKETAVAVISHINRIWPSSVELPLISSFDLQVLRVCQALSPEAPLGILLHHWDPQWKQMAKEIRCVSFHFNSRILTQARVQEIKEAGYKVLAYTVNRKRLANKLFQWGVDAVFSDYPNLLTG